MSDYEADILAWSERQGALLRCLARGERVNDHIDWGNVIEEIEDVGRSGVRAVSSLLRQALLHDLQCEAWPSAREVPHWRSEARGFRIDAKDAFSPSMRQSIDVADIYAKALAGLPESHDGRPAGPVPTDCPLTLDALLAP